MNLNYLGDGDFQELLDRNGIHRTIYDIKAYVLGTVLAPEMVMPSHLIWNILEQGTEDEIEFEDKKEGELFISQVMALWNEMAKYQGQKKAPVFSPVPEEFTDQEELLYAMTERGGEIESFLLGLAEGGFEPEKIEPESETAVFLGSLVMGSMMLEDEIKKIEENPTDENCKKGDALIRVLDKRWDEGFSLLENELKKMRANAFESLRSGSLPVELPPKIGRNDSCPCGSGKKYKKCCLQ